jgi:hypothetical protein
MTRNNADFHGVTYEHKGKQPSSYIPGKNNHLFTAHHEGSQVGFLELHGDTDTTDYQGMPSNEVANIEVDKSGKGIGEGLIRYAKSKGFSPSRSEVESDEGEGFFTRLQEKGLL